MSNLIITVISIGVMALAVGMVAYYLGGNYQTSLSSAGSITVMNQAEQLAGMWKNYMVGNGMEAPDDWSKLIDAGFLESVMEYPSAAGTETESHYFQLWPDDNNQHYYAIADLGDPAQENGNISCNRILGLATGVKLPSTNVPAQIPDFSAATLNAAAPRFTCGPLAALPQHAGILEIGQPAVFPPITHNILIYRLS